MNLHAWGAYELRDDYSYTPTNGTALQPQPLVAAVRPQHHDREHRHQSVRRVLGCRACAPLASRLLFLTVTGAARAEAPAGAARAVRPREEERGAGRHAGGHLAHRRDGLPFTLATATRPRCWRWSARGRSAPAWAARIWLIHLEGERGGGFGGVTRNVEQGRRHLVAGGGGCHVRHHPHLGPVAGAATPRAPSTRTCASGVGLPPSEPTIPFHAWATLPRRGLPLLNRRTTPVRVASWRDAALPPGPRICRCMAAGCRPGWRRGWPAWAA